MIVISRLMVGITCVCPAGASKVFRPDAVENRVGFPRERSVENFSPRAYRFSTVCSPPFLALSTGLSPFCRAAGASRFASFRRVTTAE